MNVAFVGLRHGHIFSLYQELSEHPAVTVTGAWEEDAEARAYGETVIREPFYESLEAVLADDRADAVVIGDYYGIRGSRAIAALEAGKAVLTDKPLCTSLAEWETIARLSREKALPIGCMLTLREAASLQEAARRIRGGELGTVRAVQFTAQHPLSYGARPAWYFEAGKHGGTFNDIAIHGLDAVAWLTGSAYKTTLFSRQWNAFATAEPHFKDSAVFSGLLENGAAVSGDVSYAAPSPAGFSLPGYWRFSVWGSKGWLECNAACPTVRIACEGDAAIREVTAQAATGTVLREFLAECEAHTPSHSTESVLAATRATLELQHYADTLGLNE